MIPSLFKFRAVSAVEELSQHRCEYPRVHDVFLALQNIVPPIRDGGRDLPAYVDHPIRARPATQDKCGDGHRADEFGRDSAAHADVAHDLRVVGEGWRDLLYRCPPRLVAHLTDHLRWHTDRRHEQLDRITMAVLRQDGLESLAVLPRDPSLFLSIGYIGRLVQNEFHDSRCVAHAPPHAARGLRRRSERTPT